MSTDSDRFELRSTITAESVWVAVCFLAVTGVFVSPLAGYTDLSGSARTAVAVAAALPALYLFTWRRGTIVDRAAGTVQTWCGVLAPMFRRVTSVEPEAVMLERAVIDDTNPLFVEVISLTRRSAPPVYVGRMSNVTRAHAVAENLAQFFGIPLLDRTEEIEYRMSVFGVARWNPDRPRSRWYARVRPDGRFEFRDRSRSAPFET
ncbi:MAG: hypothetical protein HY763_00675 [Planctomycetes bacterium]|nr:hypothetical protein [Planctomycetota bacterium]